MQDKAHTAEQLAPYSDRMLAAILKGLRNQGRYPEVQESILAEMGRRAARAYRVKFDQYN